MSRILLGGPQFAFLFEKNTLQQRLEDLLKTGWSLRLPTMSHFGSSSKGRMEKRDPLKTPAATDLPVCPIEILLGSKSTQNPEKPMIFDNAPAPQHPSLVGRKHIPITANNNNNSRNGFV